jgi:RNA polymerase sigma factor (sigma-70 family)
MTPLLSTPLLRAQSDGRLTALAGSGHDRAFEEIVERYRRPLQRYLRRLLSEALAEDVLQATFVRAWQSLRAGTEVRDLRSWLYRIAHNQAINTLRAAGAALPETPDLLALSTEAEVEQREELRATLDGIGALPDRQRAALLAVAVADRPHADVAAELGLSDGALRQLLLRARSALRAAATAITPYPILTWAAGGQEATASRVAEVAAGAGGAGAAIKAGAALLAAGAVVAGAPALRDEHAAPIARHAPAAVHKAHAAPTPVLTRTTARHSTAAPAVAHATRSASSTHRSRSNDDKGHESASSKGPGPSGSGSDDSSGSGDGRSGGDDNVTAVHRSSSGSGAERESESGSGTSAAAPAVVSHSGSDESDDRSGEGSGGGDGSSGGDERLGSDGERSGDD